MGHPERIGNLHLHQCVQRKELMFGTEGEKREELQVSEVAAAHCWGVNGMFAAATSHSRSSHSGLPPSERGQHCTGTERRSV